VRHPGFLFILWLAPLAAFANAVPPMATVGGAQAARAQSAAIQWPHPLSDALVTETTPDGKVKQHLDLPVVDGFLHTLSEHADRYPPQFDNDAERTDASDKLTHLTAILAGQDTGDKVDLDILRREAFAYSMSCNMELPEGCSKATLSYRRLLKRTPDEPGANYLYGAFLAGMPSRLHEAEGYLKKALKLGVKRANYTLGVVYLDLNEKQKALEHLQQYAIDFPDDANAPKLIDAIKNGKLKAGKKP